MFFLLFQLVLNWAFLKTIWVPDTFLINGKKSYLHKITVPNQVNLYKYNFPTELNIFHIDFALSSSASVRTASSITLSV